MIAEIKDGKMIPYQSLLEALKIHGGRDRKPRIAAVGAGGKTSLLRALAAEYRMQGRKPVVTTTTHILKEDSPAFIESPDMEELTDILEREGWVFTGGKADKGRAGILPENILRQVLGLPCPVLIESDGARMLPVKIPGCSGKADWGNSFPPGAHGRISGQMSGRCAGTQGHSPAGRKPGWRQERSGPGYGVCGGFKQGG